MVNSCRQLASFALGDFLRCEQATAKSECDWVVIDCQCLSPSQSIAAAPVIHQSETVLSLAVLSDWTVQVVHGTSLTADGVLVSFM